MKSYTVVLAFKSGHQETLDINKSAILKIVQMWLSKKKHKWIPSVSMISYKSYPSYMWVVLPTMSENFLKDELLAITIINTTK